MSRNGSGVYSLPAGNPVTTGTTISSTWANTTLSDIATALTQSIAYNGVTTPIANLPMGGYKLTGLGVATTSGDALSYGNAITASSIVGTSVTDSGLTSGRVTYASTGGLLADSASFTFDGTNLGIANINGATLSLKTGGTTGLYIDGSQNVGIGTSSSTYKLQMVGGSVAFSNTTGNVCNLEIAGNGNTPGTNSFVIQQATTSDTLLWNRANANLSFGTNSTERMRIDSSGNVGIGTSSPAGKLAVSDGTVVGEINPYSASSGCYIGTRTNHAVLFQVNASEKMRIDSSGNLLVNQTGTSSGADGKFSSTSTSGSGQPAGTFKSSDGASQYTGIFYNSATTGNNSFVLFGTEGTFTARGGITYNRGAGQVAYNVTSDERLKDNIVDSPSALNKIASVKIRSFDWKETRNHLDFGVIAQELIEVAPECVTEGQDNEDGTIKNPWSVDTSALVPAMIKAIQEQQALITQLQADVAALKNGNMPSV